MIPPPISAALKERTREHHIRAEHHPLQQRLAKAQMDLESWRDIVAQNRLVHEVLESSIDGASPSDPRLSTVFQPHHRRLAKFDTDLKALATPAQRLHALPPTQHAMAWIKSLAISNPIALLGVLYVVEGATNGGQFLAKPLRIALNLPSDEGLLSLHPHADRTRELWAQFRTNIDSITLTPDEFEAIIHAAGETFDMIGRLLDGVTQAHMHPAAAAAGTPR